MKDIPYLSIGAERKTVTLRINLGFTTKRFPLTATGCRAAGLFLYSLGIHRWQHASCVNHPREYKPWFNGDVPTLIQEGWDMGFEKEAAPRRTLLVKMLAHCAAPDFQTTLTDDEKAAFHKLRTDDEEKPI